MSGETPTVSVIIPVHNRPYMLGEAVHSVLDQTYTDYEIIVVDDGSTDDIESVIREFDLPQLRYVRQENQGASTARNLGMREALGTYIAFLDSDDWFHPDKLGTQVAYLNAHPACGLVYSWYCYVDQTRRPRQTIKSCLSGSVYTTFLKRSIKGLMATPTVMIRRDVIAQTGGFDETMRFAEDTDLWCRIARHYEIGCIPRPLTDVREHSGRSVAELAVDPRTHLEAQLHLLEKAVSNDGRIGPLFCRRLYADAYTFISCYTLLHTRNVPLTLRLLLRGLAYFPFPPEGFRVYATHFGYFLRVRLRRWFSR